jgi:hypothetical protein
LSGLDVQPGSGALFASSGRGGANPGSLFRINPRTGAATLIGATGFAAVPSVAFADNGTLFASADTDGVGGADSLATINPRTAAASVVGAFGTDFMDGIAIDPAKGTLFGVGTGNGDVLFTINKLTGAATAVGIITLAGSGDPLPAPISGLGFDPAGNLYGSFGGGAFAGPVSGTIGLIDRNALTFTPLGDATPDAAGSVSGIAVIPEPGSLTLFGLGTLSLLGYGWRRRR